MTRGAALSERARRTLGGYFTTLAALVGVGVFRGLPVRDVKMAPESIYTVFRDLEKQDAGYREVDRMLRITVLLDDPIQCYTALGHIHHLWPAVPNHFDDYIFDLV